jgi:hypothetical protein
LVKYLDAQDDKRFEHAFFLYQHALEINWRFMVLMRGLCDSNCGTLKGTIKSNLVRITQKIQDNKGNPFSITDMVRATITVDEPTQLETIYNAIDKE